LGFAHQGKRGKERVVKRGGACSKERLKRKRSDGMAHLKPDQYFAFIRLVNRYFRFFAAARPALL
jgi:hypothetical protein